MYLDKCTGSFLRGALEFPTRVKTGCTIPSLQWLWNSTDEPSPIEMPPQCFHQ